jgi:cytochrome b involved in lipid metabolism
MEGEPNKPKLAFNLGFLSRAQPVQASNSVEADPKPVKLSFNLAPFSSNPVSEEEKQKKVDSDAELLSAPKPMASGPIRKDPGSRPQNEFMQIMLENKDPLHMQGKELPVYSIEEVGQHKKPDDAWIALNGKVYNVTMYLNYHPGGKIIKSVLGKDATTTFMRYHPWVNIDAIVGKLCIGTLGNRLTLNV